MLDHSTIYLYLQEGYNDTLLNWWRTFSSDFTLTAKRYLPKIIIKVVESETEIPENGILLFGYHSSDNVLPRLETRKFYKLCLRKGLEVENSIQPLLSYYFDKEFDKDYWLVLSDLAKDIEHSISPKEKKGKIFIAETVASLEKSRLSLKRELVQYGYDVYPKGDYPLINTGDSIKREVERCDLIIHMIDESFGQEIGRPEIQNEIASKVAANNPQLKRYIWGEPSNYYEDGEGLNLERLKRDVQQMAGAEFIQTPLVKFKEYIRYNFKKQTGKQQEEVSSDKLVYLIHDVSDKEQSLKITSLLKDQGYKVVQPNFGTNAIGDIEKHRKNLAHCDSFLIYHSGENKQWVEMKLLDLLKAPGYGKVSKSSIQALMVGRTDLGIESPSEQLKVIKIEGVNTIDKSSIEPFIKELSTHGN